MLDLWWSDKLLNWLYRFLYQSIGVRLWVVRQLRATEEYSQSVPDLEVLLDHLFFPFFLLKRFSVSFPSMISYFIDVKIVSPIFVRLFLLSLLHLLQILIFQNWIRCVPGFLWLDFHKTTTRLFSGSYHVNDHLICLVYLDFIFYQTELLDQSYFSAKSIMIARLLGRMHLAANMLCIWDDGYFINEDTTILMLKLYLGPHGSSTSSS